MHQVKSSFVLNVLFNSFQSYRCSEMLCCNMKFILQNLIICSKFCINFELKENYSLIKIYFGPDRFSVNGFFLFCFVLLIPWQFVPVEGQGEFDLKIFPRGWRFWYDLIKAFLKSPYLSWVYGGGGGGLWFQLTSVFILI